MGKSKDFVETEDTKFADQLGDFAEGLAIYGNQLGFTPQEIQDAADDAAFMKYVVERQTNFQLASAGFTAFKDLARYGKDNEQMPVNYPVSPQYPPPQPAIRPANIEGRFRQRAAKAKASSGYSETIGEELKIVAAKTVFDPAAGKPKTRVELNAGFPDVFFVKGNFDGVEAYINRGSGYSTLGRFNHSPVPDNKVILPPGQSANWKYKFMYVYKDKLVGQMSDEITIPVSGDNMSQI